MVPVTIDPPVKRVDLWWVPLELLQPRTDELLKLLDEEEAAKAGRFRFPRDRARSIVTRATLRWLLACYAGGNPADIRFVTGAHGKPALAQGELQFNSSHAGDWIVHAFCVGRRVGVDVERMKGETWTRTLIEHAFARDELRRLGAASGPEIEQLALRAWTRKEALLKALGTGLLIPPAEVGIDVDDQGYDANRARSFAWPAGSSTDLWSIWDFQPSPGHLGSLVLAGPSLPLLQRYIGTAEVGGLPPGVEVVKACMPK